MKKNTVLLLVLVGSMLLIGCGGGGGSSSSSSSATKVGLAVTAVDGPIQNAYVKLATLQAGVISDSVLTDNEGKATLSIVKTKLDNLLDEDTPYLIVESTANTTIQTKIGDSNSWKNVAQGRLKLKSFFPPASYLKQVMANNNGLLSGDSEINKAAVVSHFSAAQAALLEKEIKAELGSGSVMDGNEITSITQAQMRRIKDKRNNIVSQMSNAAFRNKVVLLASAVKACIEEDVNSVRNGVTYQSTVGVDKIVLDLAETSNAVLDAGFRTKLNTFSQKMFADVTNPIFVNAFDASLRTAISTGSVTNIVNSTSTTVFLGNVSFMVDVAGTIKNSKVTLASMRKGVLSQAAYTDATGAAKIEISRDAINGLEDNDFLYFIAEAIDNSLSLASSQTSYNPTTGTTHAIPAGIFYKSFLSKADALKTYLKTATDLDFTKNATFAAGCKINSLSSSKMLLLERELLSKNIISSNLEGAANSAVTTNQLVLTDRFINGLANQLATQSDLGAKYLLLATAYKGMIENNVSRIATTTTSYTKLGDFMKDFAKSTTTSVSTSFTSFTTVAQEVLALTTQTAGGFLGSTAQTALNGISVNAIKAATSQSGKIHPTVNKAKFALIMPYDNESGVLARQVELGVKLALNTLISQGKVEIVTFNSNGATENVRLFYHGVNQAGTTTANALVDDPDLVAVGDFTSSGTAAMLASPKATEVLCITAATSTVFTTGFKNMVMIAPPNDIQSLSMFKSLKDSSKTSMTRYAVIMESKDKGNDYIYDLYNQFMKVYLDAEMDVLSKNSTQISTYFYPQLAGSFVAVDGVMPINAIKELSEIPNKPGLQLVYLGLSNGFASLVKGLNDSSVNIQRFWGCDGIVSSALPGIITNAGVTANQLAAINLSGFSLTTTTGTTAATFETAYKAANNQQSPGLYGQYGYDMGQYFKLVYDNIVADNSKFVTREGFVNEAQTAVLNGLTGVKKHIPETKMGTYDMFKFSASGFAKTTTVINN